MYQINHNNPSALLRGFCRKRCEDAGQKRIRCRVECLAATLAICRCASAASSTRICHRHPSNRIPYRHPQFAMDSTRSASFHPIALMTWLCPTISILKNKKKDSSVALFIQILIVINLKINEFISVKIFCFKCKMLSKFRFFSCVLRSKFVKFWLFKLVRGQHFGLLVS